MPDRKTDGAAALFVNVFGPLPGSEAFGLGSDQAALDRVHRND